MPKHLRLDAELVRRGLARSRAEAKLAIEEGIVHVNGVVADRATTMVAGDTPVTVARDARRFVSRGGDKLESALERLPVRVEARRWMDAGASTGGFTDCLLARGAREVLAVDVGYGQLDWKLRNDDRVVVMERVNLREVESATLPWRPEALAADLSFISLRTVLPALVAVMEPACDALLMVKPQFEVGREHVGKGGVVREPQLWIRAMQGVTEVASGLGWTLLDAVPSGLPGPSGNREFFLWFGEGEPADPIEAFGRAAAEASGR